MLPLRTHSFVNGRPGEQWLWSRSPVPAPFPGTRGAAAEGVYRRAVAGVERVAQLRRARDLVDLRYMEPLDLAALARESGYSRCHFARSFKDAFGETPGAYLTRRRIERAKDLLRGANLSVTEICHLVGFTSLGSFSARFRGLVGCSPSAYRRRQVAAGGPPPVPGCFLMAWARPRPAGRDPATTEKHPGGCAP